jgi:hypothetical protein
VTKQYWLERQKDNEKPTKGGTKGREKSTKIKLQQGLSSFDDTVM